MVDFHTHILPAVDDGSASVEESIALLEEQQKQGVRWVVLTPHFYADQDSPSAFLARRAEAEQSLRRALLDREDLPKVLLGAEVHFFRGMSESEHLKDLTIADTGYILVEMPMPPWKEWMYQELLDIHFKQGLVPIIAHMDRYISPLRTYHIPERLVEMPVVIQVNARFFLDKRTRKMALRLMRQGAIHLLGSDCHNLLYRRPNLQEAHEVIRKYLGEEFSGHVQACERHVLKGIL